MVSLEDALKPAPGIAIPVSALAGAILWLPSFSFASGAATIRNFVIKEANPRR